MTYPPGLTSAPPRPQFREPHRVTFGPVAAGAAGTALWYLLFGLVGWSIPSYLWSTILAAALAWMISIVLVLLGDRGVAVGIAAVSAVAVGIAALVIELFAIVGDRWLLW